MLAAQRPRINRILSKAPNERTVVHGIISDSWEAAVVRHSANHIFERLVECLEELKGFIQQPIRELAVVGSNFVKRNLQSALASCKHALDVVCITFLRVVMWIEEFLEHTDAIILDHIANT